MENITNLTVRVYGLLIDSQARLLVSDEIIQGKYYTKLPGGGLDLGEGTRECLAREFAEEANIAVTVGAHIYTTDYFQPSAFREEQQFMGIYYFVHSDETEQIIAHDQAFDFSPEQKELGKECEAFRWIPIAEVSENDFDLPTDKVAVRIAKEMFFSGK